MGLIAEFRLRAKHVIGPVLGICVVAYFAYHVVQGDRGMIAWWNLKQRVAHARDALLEVSERRGKIEHRVSLLNPSSLDRDMLDERARLMLNYGHDNELIIFPKPTKVPRGK